MISHDISSPRLTLTALDRSRVTERYRGWMNDPTITQYLESRFAPLSIEALSEFVDEVRNSSHSYFFAILDRETGEHIGNIKIGPINPHHLRAPIGLIVGESSAWGKGVATEALETIARWAFTELGLYKLVAGTYANNIGSIRAFEKAGFRIEGRQVGDVVLADGTRGNAVTFGLTRDEFEGADHS